MVYLLGILGVVVILLLAIPLFKRFLKKKYYKHAEECLHSIEAAIGIKILQSCFERFDKETTRLLMLSVLGELFMIPPSSLEEANFREVNRELIQKETRQILNTEEVREAVGVAYMIHFMLIGLSTKHLPHTLMELPIEAKQFIAKATSLGILIPPLSQFGNTPLNP